MFREDAKLEARRYLIAAVAGTVVAIDRASGERCWQRKLDAKGPLALHVHRGRVFVAGPRRILVALDYESGDVVWRESTSHDVGPATILIDEDALFVARGGVVDCFGLDGEVRWYQPLDGLSSGSVLLAFPGVAADVPMAP